MKKDQCLFCHSKACYSRIVSSEDNGATYDEIACRKHALDLDKHSDDKAPKVMKLFISSTGKLKRGDDITPYIQGMEEQNVTTKTT